jgi:hypothetical protein
MVEGVLMIDLVLPPLSPLVIEIDTARGAPADDQIQQMTK